MTVYARVITIGRNSDMPKIVRLPVGVGVDGSVIRAPITIRGDEMLCPDCKGWAEDCDRCGDRGIVEIEQDEETSAASWCLSTAEVGRSLSPPGSGRPPSSGMMPVARAAGDLPCFEGPKTHTVKRSVLRPPASHSPSAEAPHNAPTGALLERAIDAATVIVGLAVFGTIAYLFLVLT